MPANDDPNAHSDPVAAPNYKVVRAIVIILGVLIVLAFTALVWGFIARLSGHGADASAQAPDFVLPAGAKIVQVTPTTSNRMVVVLQTPAGGEVDIFDTDTGKLVVRIRP